MNNDTLLEAIERQISSVEGRLQNAMKHPTGANINNNDEMRELLKFLHEKRTEILKRKGQE